MAAWLIQGHITSKQMSRSGPLEADSDTYSDAPSLLGGGRCQERGNEDSRMDQGQMPGKDAASAWSRGKF